jgi:hypothetical protein
MLTSQPTPNIGAGVVVGTEAAVILTNKLHTLLQTQSNPDTESLTKIFEEYQSDYEKRAKFFVDIGETLLDRATQRTWVDWVIDWYVDPWLRPIIFKKLLIPMLAKGPKLSFVPFDERTGTTPWYDGRNLEIPGKTWYQRLSESILSTLGFREKAKQE